MGNNVTRTYFELLPGDIFSIIISLTTPDVKSIRNFQRMCPMHSCAIFRQLRSINNFRVTKPNSQRSLITFKEFMVCHQLESLENCPLIISSFEELETVARLKSLRQFKLILTENLEYSCWAHKRVYKHDMNLFTRIIVTFLNVYLSVHKFNESSDQGKIQSKIMIVSKNNDSKKGLVFWYDGSLLVNGTSLCYYIHHPSILSLLKQYSVSTKMIYIGAKTNSDANSLGIEYKKYYWEY